MFKIRDNWDLTTGPNYTGKVIIETIEKRKIDPVAVPGIVVKNHGPFAWGKSPENAVYNAVVMEKVAEMDLKTLRSYIV